MKRYKEEVDSLRASDSLRRSIEDLTRQPPKKKTSGKRFTALVAVLAVVLAVSVIGVPTVFLATQKAQSAKHFAASNKSFDYAADMYENDAMAVAEEGQYVKTASTGEQTSLQTNLPANRKLIRDANLNVETKAYDAFLKSVNARLAALGGYIQSTDSSAYYSGSRYCTLVLRVPADKLDDFLAHVDEVGTITSQSTSVQDVTDDYIDLESRVKALETEQETLLGLLQKADKLSDTLEIQNRLSEVRTSLESYKGKLKALEGQIAYSTVTIRLEEVERVSAPEGKTFMQQVRANLSENLYNIGQGFRNFAIAFLSGLPYIVLWLVLIAVVVLVVVLIVRKRRRK